MFVMTLYFIDKLWALAPNMLERWTRYVIVSVSFVLFLQRFYTSMPTLSNSEGKETERRKEKKIKNMSSPAIGCQCWPPGYHCCAVPAMARMLPSWAAEREQRWWACLRRWLKNSAGSSRRRYLPSGSTTSLAALTRTGQTSRPATPGGTPSPETYCRSRSTNKHRFWWSISAPYLHQRSYPKYVQFTLPHTYIVFYCLYYLVICIEFIHQLCATFLCF